MQIFSVPSPIKSIQRGATQITAAGAYAVEVAVAISSVDMTKTIVNSYCNTGVGSNSTHTGVGGGARLNTATQLICSRGENGGNSSGTRPVTVYWEVIEYV